LFVLAVASGGVLSAAKNPPAAIVTIGHQVIPFLTVLAAALALYLPWPATRPGRATTLRPLRWPQASHPTGDGTSRRRRPPIRRLLRHPRPSSSTQSCTACRPVGTPTHGTPTHGTPTYGTPTHGTPTQPRRPHTCIPPPPHRRSTLNPPVGPTRRSAGLSPFCHVAALPRVAHTIASPCPHCASPRRPPVGTPLGCVRWPIRPASPSPQQRRLRHASQRRARVLPVPPHRHCRATFPRHHRSRPIRYMAHVPRQ
jgi:hypothetical protein